MGITKEKGERQELIPSCGAIVDFSKAIEFIFHNPNLRKLKDFTGIRGLIRNIAWDDSIGRESSTWTYLETIDLDLTEQGDPGLYQLIGVDVNELASAIRGLEDCIELEIFRKLDERLRYEFIENGFYVHKWISPTQAIIQTLTGKLVPYSDKRAVFRRNTSKDVGSDP